MSVQVGIINTLRHSTVTADCRHGATLPSCRATQTVADSRHSEVRTSEEDEP